MRCTRALAAFVAATVAAATLAGGPAHASSGVLTAAEVTAALQGVHERLAVPTASNTDIDLRQDGTIHFGTSSTGDIVVSLPGAHKAETANGRVTYRSANSATVAIQAVDSAQVLLVAANASAPSEYPFGVSNGFVAALPDGGLMLLDRNHKPSRMIPAPWAVDAVGKTVATRYAVSADNSGFTQIVSHDINGVVYPVVADPYISWYWDGAVVTLTRGNMATVMYGGTQALIPMLLIPGIGWAAIAGVLWVAANATWAYANHKCAWFWLPYIGWGSSMGWYNC